MKVSTQIFLVVLSLMLCASIGIAQTTTATIVGDITDPQGGAIAGATITVKSSATGVSRQVVTSDLGTYRVFPLNPGTYSVSATSPGFKTKVQENVTLEIASNVKVDFQLEVGAVSETVEVTANAVVLQTQEASVGGTVTSTVLERMPVNGRNYTRLILLMPGTSDQGSSQSNGTFSGTQMVSVNGQRRQDNNFTVDGVDNNFMMMNSPGGSPPMDAIQEFRVLNNTSAEFGRSAGANVNIAVKSGTHDLHGSAYEYLRNDKFDANDFFANRQGTGKVPFRQNQYGFTLGGPVIIPKVYNGHNKTFWFASWEGYRRRRGGTNIMTTPIEAQRGGDFSQQPRAVYDPFSSRLLPDGSRLRDPFPGNIIPAGRINAGSRKAVDLMMPLPNRGGLANNFVNTASLSNDRDIWNLRGDHTFSARDTAFVRWTRQNVGEINPSSNPKIVTNQRFDVRNIAGGWNHIFSSSTVLEAKFGYNKPWLPGGSVNPSIPRGDFIDQTGIRMFQREVLFDPVPGMNAVGEFSFGPGGQITGDHVYQAIVNFSKVISKHSFKAGFTYNWRQFFTNTSNPMNGGADFDQTMTNLPSDSRNTGHSFASWLLGVPSTIRRGQGNTLTDARINNLAAYVQDDWRVNSKLTFNIGLRYEYTQPAYELTDRLGNLLVRRDPQTGTYYGELMWAGVNPEASPYTGIRNEPPRTLGFGRSLQQANKRDFAPRVGFAWQVDRKTVVRSAYGIFFNTTFVQELQDKRKFWPYTIQQLISANTGTVPDLIITDAGPAFSNTSAIGGWPQDPYKRSPYSQQWNFTIQRQVLNDMTVDIGYVGSANKRQIGYTSVNQVVSPGPGDQGPRRLLAASGLYGNMDGGINQFSGTYHSLRINADKRFGHGLTFLVNYTWGKSLTDQSSLAEQIAEDQFNRRLDWGRSSIDLRHIFQSAWVYELPFGKGRRMGSGWSPVVSTLFGGWSVEGILRLQTGAPINVVIGQDQANVGNTRQRPNLLRDPNTGHSRNVDVPWFDTAAFVMPALYTFGNAAPNVVSADGRQTFDFSLQKDFRIREKHTIQFRSEYYNLPNHVNMGNPNGTFTSSAFGKVTSATSARQIQFGLRYAF
jgi:outer membrane receptor protein involved in Fe transport